jgi:hypothetical protein
MIYWCEKDGFLAQDIANWKDAKFRLGRGEVVFTILAAKHWVTVIGVHDGLAYVIDYCGLRSIPEHEFARSIGNVPVFAPGCIVAMRRK